MTSSVWLLWTPGMVAANLYYTRIHILRDFTASYFILIHCNFALSNSYSQFHCLKKIKNSPKKTVSNRFLHTYHSKKQDRKLGEKIQSRQSINLFSILLSHIKHNFEFTHFKTWTSKHELFHIYRKLVKTARISWLLENSPLG